MPKTKLSVVLATKNEEQNIGSCLESIKSIADEIVVVDEDSIDKTREIAKKFGAKVFKVKHESIFHKTKQKALDKAIGDWILQLDADERVTKPLASEIKEVVNSSNEELIKRTVENLQKHKNTIHGSRSAENINLFIKHQRLIEDREGGLGERTGKVVAFFVPRRNMFLGKPLVHGGVYPDGVIRLIKKGKARFPAKSVHELMEIDGEVAWLFNDLEHHDSPTFQRYLDRSNRYTDLTAQEYKQSKLPVSYWNLFKYSFLLPTYHFLLLYIRHKGFLDGMRGFLWSLFSALHFPIAYFKYWGNEK